MNFNRGERFFKYFCWFVCLVAFPVGFYLNFYIRDPTIAYFELNFFFQCVQCLLTLGIFVILDRLLHRYSYLEHKRSKKSMRLYITLITLIQSLFIFNNLLSLKSDLKREHELLGLFQDYFQLIFFTLELPTIFIAATILHFKANDDVLQGISKLDHLLKISIFQVYKDKKLQKTFVQRMLTASSSRSSV